MSGQILTEADTEWHWADPVSVTPRTRAYWENLERTGRTEQPKPDTRWMTCWPISAGDGTSSLWEATLSCCHHLLRLNPNNTLIPRDDSLIVTREQAKPGGVV